MATLHGELKQSAFFNEFDSGEPANAAKTLATSEVRRVLPKETNRSKRR